MVEIRVPTLGESVTEATVATWFKKEGEPVALDEMLCELETDKVTVEVPAAAAGVLSEIVAKEGETVGVDALLATIDEKAGDEKAGDEKAGDKAGDEKAGDKAGGQKASGPAGNGAKKPARAKATPAGPPSPAQEVAGAAADEGEESAPANAQSVDVRVPALGESVTEATVSTWFKAEGDAVSQDEMLCELETDKVSVEVPAAASGTLSEILAEAGTTVAADAILARIAGGGGTRAAGAKAEAAAAGRSEAPPGRDAGRAPGGQGSDDGQARGGQGRDDGQVRGGQGRDVEDAPSARKLMAERGLARDDVDATGRGGRVMKEDVLRAGEGGEAQKADGAPREASARGEARSEAPPMPRAPVAAEDAAREERVKMTRLRQTIARRLKEAQNTAAMLTTYNEVDMTGVMELRSAYKDLFEKKHGVKLGFMSFFTKACCHALKEVPEVNAEIDGTDVVYKNFVHMGIAVGTPSGLVVPVVRDADAMSFAEIEKRINELGARARDGKLSMAEMQGGTFTISNGGVYGSLMSSPILNPPQSGILGMHKIEERPMVVGGAIVPRPMMYLALSYDHRVVDGKGAVTFLVRVKEALEDPRRLLMDL